MTGVTLYCHFFRLCDQHTGQIGTHLHAPLLLQESGHLDPPVTGTKPPPLYNFSFTKIDNRRAVVFGGLTSEGALGDAYVLELDKLVDH